MPEEWFWDEDEDVPEDCDEFDDSIEDEGS